MGRQVRPTVTAGHRLPLALGLSWSLLLAPALVWGVLHGGGGGLVAEVTVLQVGMAPMVTAGILAADHGLEPPLAAALVGVGLVLSLLTVPAWAALI